MKLEEKLISLRKAKGLSQIKLAEMMDVSRQAVSRWETGVAVPSVENLKYLGNLYDVSLDYLFNDSADDPERSRGIPDKPEDEMLPVLDSVVKNGKRKSVKWVAVALGLLVLVVAIYILVIDSNEGDFVTINDIQRKEVESKEGAGFDFEW